MSDRELKLNGGWVEVNSASRRLTQKGYHVSGYMDKGKPYYMLHRVEDSKYKVVHEFNSAEELNNMVKLLLDE